MKKLLISLLAVISLNTFASADRPIVKIQSGALQGTTEYNMTVFKNIPYAAPPVGELRW